jgi:hypothetical protein
VFNIRGRGLYMIILTGLSGMIMTHNGDTY